MGLKKTLKYEKKVDRPSPNIVGARTHRFDYHRPVPTKDPVPRDHWLDPTANVQLSRSMNDSRSKSKLPHHI